jgi:LacI family transcriptional regulator
MVMGVGMKKSVTIRDVALRAGVSIAAVSRALNQSGYVSSEIKQRVHEAVQELHYRPHDSARGLKLQRTNTIGLVIADITNPFYAELAAGVLSSAKKWGYHVILAAMDEEPAQEEEYLNVLMEKRVDGILAVATGQNARLWREAIELGIKVVLVDRKIASLPDADVVLLDNVKGGYDATAYLTALGHRRIGIMSGPLSTTTGQGRLQGYYKALEEKALPIDPELVQMVSFKRKSGIQAIEQLLALRKPPTAIFATNNLIGETAMFALRERGIQIPEEISLVMFDDVPWASLTIPALTVVAQPVSLLGKHAVEQLMQRLQHPDVLVSEGRTIVLEPELIVRESCAPPMKLPVSGID